MTIAEKRMLFYDRLLELSVLHGRCAEKYCDWLFRYMYWKLKHYGYASGQITIPYGSAQYVMRTVSNYYTRLSRTDWPPI